MGNLGIMELLLILPGCLVGGAVVVASVLGTMAFFKVRKLEKRICELAQRQGNKPRP